MQELDRRQLMRVHVLGSDAVADAVSLADSLAARRWNSEARDRRDELIAELDHVPTVVEEHTTQIVPGCRQGRSG